MHVGTGKVITEVALADVKDIDIAVAAAKRAMSESWGTKCSSYDRGRLLSKLADLYEEHKDEMQEQDEERAHGHDGREDDGAELGADGARRVGDAQRLPDPRQADDGRR